VTRRHTLADSWTRTLMAGALAAAKLLVAEELAPFWTGFDDED
jgi:hypothetical protein